jgi:hypothetical protein
MADSPAEPKHVKAKRINCRNCGYRIHADAEICPHCHADPRTPRPLPSNLLIAVLVLLMLGVVCAVGFVYFLDPIRQLASIGLNPQPTTTVRIIFTVATPITPTATALSTSTPLPTATATSRFSPTPTRKGAPTASATATRPTQTPGPNDYGAPKLVSPAIGAFFAGIDTDFALEWQNVAPNGLRENEWYLITITYTSRANVTVTQTSWSRETKWNVKKDWWNDASLNSRTFYWNVQLMQIDGADPYSSPARTPVSRLSETWKFLWQ